MRRLGHWQKSPGGGALSARRIHTGASFEQKVSTYLLYSVKVKLSLTGAAPVESAQEHSRYITFYLSAIYNVSRHVFRLVYIPRTYLLSREKKVFEQLRGRLLLCWR